MSAEQQWYDFRSQLREHQESMDSTEWDDLSSQLRDQTVPVQKCNIENHRDSGATLHAACKDGRLEPSVGSSICWGVAPAIPEGLFSEVLFSGALFS